MIFQNVFWSTCTVRKELCEHSLSRLCKLTADHVSLSLFQSWQRIFARACTWEEPPHALIHKQGGVHQSVRGAGWGGVHLTAGACSLAEPPLSHALQLKAVRRRQWSEGQGLRWWGFLKSFVMLILCCCCTLLGLKAWTIRVLLCLTKFS